MGSGLYSHTTRSSGTVLTAAIYNADHLNHITNHNTEQMDDYSASVSQMRAQTDPGESGTESQATSLAGELERLRFALAELKGTTYWYQTATVLVDVVDDTTPQLGGDLDLNGKNIDFPTTANVSDCLDEDDMASNSATALVTQQSAKAYVDSKAQTTARAWVRFAATDGTVADSYNVTSVTDGGTGIFTVNLTTALGNANFAAVAMLNDSTVPYGDGTTGWRTVREDIDGRTTSAVQLKVFDNSTTPGLKDSGNISLLVFGDAA